MFRSKITPQLQSEASECGLACLTMVARYFGADISLADLRRRSSSSLKGMTLQYLAQCAAGLQLNARALRIELEDLGQVRTPCILHWNLNHFVVFGGLRRTWRGQKMAQLFDPACGERLVPFNEASRSFSGVALEILPSPSFQAGGTISHSRLSFSQLTQGIPGLVTALWQVFMLAVAIEIFSLGMPLLRQFVIDEVVVANDRELVMTAMTGLLIALVAQTLISTGRSLLLVRWGLEVSYQWGARVFSHLVRLPIAFFEKRHLGDIISRFSSLGSVQQTLTSAFVEVALDGLMAVVTCGLMMVFSPDMGGIVLACCAVYVALRASTYGAFQRAARERLLLAGRESSHFMESIRAALTIKLFAKEELRTAQWLNLRNDLAQRDLSTQRMAILFRSATALIFGIQGILVLFVGSQQIARQEMTVGMLIAFLSFSSTFSSRIFKLTDAAINIRMLRLHMDRLADIVQENAEPLEVGMSTPLSDFSLSLRNVRFRYSSSESWVLDGINLEIPAGQHLALSGASGSGKTTLCKILLGLLVPTEGEVLVGGKPMPALGIQQYRQMVASVTQDDVLLCGSIDQNISFFDDKTDMKRVQDCARKAAIHDEICAMPMQYYSLVGDMGSSLSGGQKQRILLARALYRTPRILGIFQASCRLKIAFMPPSSS